MTTLNIDDLLNGTLDNLADLPEFRPFPAGTYKVNLTFDFDKTKAHVLYARLTMLELIEQADPQEQPLEPGAKDSVRYDLTNEYAQGNVKKLLAVVAGHFGAASLKDLIAQVKDLECFVVTKQIKSKKDAGKVYTDIAQMEIV